MWQRKTAFEIQTKDLSNKISDPSELFIKQGGFSFGEGQGGVNLRKWLKEEFLHTYHVPFIDACCSDTPYNTDILNIPATRIAKADGHTIGIATYDPAYFTDDGNGLISLLYNYLTVETDPIFNTWLTSTPPLYPSSVSGTTNYISKFTSTYAIGNSMIQDNGSKVVMNYASGAFGTDNNILGISTSNGWNNITSDPFGYSGIFVRNLNSSVNTGTGVHLYSAGLSASAGMIMYATSTNNNTLAFYNEYSGSRNIKLSISGAGDLFAPYLANTTTSEILFFDNTTGKITYGNVPAGVTTLSSLTDVNITSPSNLQLLSYNSSTSKWINWTPNFLTSFTETDPIFTTWLSTSPFSSYLLSSVASSTYQPLNNYLIDLANTTPTTGKVLEFNGTHWVATTLDTSIVPENTNLYFTNARARSAISLTTTGSSGASTYSNSTGILNIPVYTLSGLGGISLTSLSATSPIFYNNTTGVISSQAATSSLNGYLTSIDWTTFNNKQSALSGTGFVKIAGTTISYDNSSYYLSSNPSNYISLTNLSSTATGLTYTNTTGVFSLTSGYLIPTTASYNNTNWDLAYTNRITSLTTTGTGAATLISNVLNIPTPSLSGYVPYTGANTDLNLGSNNLIVNNIFDGFSSVVASASLITLTATSVSSYLVTGSGGQTFKMPNATTIPNGALYTFNNNQSSGAILVNNNSNTLIKSVPSGGCMILELLDNSTSAGSWDTHFQAPSNVSWSTNTFDYAGSITSATWNGVSIADNRIASSANWNTAYTNRITSLTTTGSSGASTLISNTLNIPNYTLSGLGGQPLATNLTSLAGLSYTSLGFVKMSASGTFSLDTSTYLTTITGIGATGNLSGTYPSPSVTGALGVNYPALPTSGNYQLQAAISAGSVTAWSFVAPSNPMTTLGDIIYGGTVTSGVAAPTRLALGTQNYFLQAGATAPTYFNLFGTSNTFTASQNVTVNAGAPTYGMVVTNTTTGGGYTTNGAGIKFVNNTGIASINYLKSGGGASTDNTLNIISDLGISLTANGVTGDSHNFNFIGTGSMTAVLTGNSSNPRTLLGLYNGNGGSTYTQISMGTNSGGYIKGSGTNSSYLGITLGYNTTDIFSTNTTGCGVFTQNPSEALEVNGNVKINHLIGRTSAPTISAGTGAGTAPTVSIVGTDLGGYISITTGTTPTLSATIVTVTFNTAYGVTPKCVHLSPANSNAALLTGVTQVFADQANITTTTFTITAGTTALIAATTYKFYYSIIQ